MLGWMKMQCNGLNPRSSHMKCFFFVICLFNFGWVEMGHSSTPVVENPIDKLVGLHQILVQAPDEAELHLAHLALQEAMVDTWRSNDFWTTSCDALGDRMGVVHVGEKNERLAIITWNAEKKNRTQLYGGVVIFFDRFGHQIVQELEHYASTVANSSIDSKKRFKPEKWPGAIYYDLILQHQGKTPIYTLLGWDGADGIRTRKIVETLTIHGGKLRFGTPVIDAGKGSQKRLILEFSDNLTAMLRWREDLNMIVMDHLSAPDASLRGRTAFYGPDMTYDALVWQKNHWVLKENVDVRDPDMKGPWNNPKRPRRRPRNG